MRCLRQERFSGLSTPLPGSHCATREHAEDETADQPVPVPVLGGPSPLALHARRPANDCAARNSAPAPATAAAGHKPAAAIVSEGVKKSGAAARGSEAFAARRSTVRRGVPFGAQRQPAGFCAAPIIHGALPAAGDCLRIADCPRSCGWLRILGRPRSVATARQILCHADQPMAHCLWRVTGYGSRIDRA